MKIHFETISFIIAGRWRFSLVDFLFMAFRCFLIPATRRRIRGKHFFVFCFLWLLWRYRFVRDKCFLLLFRYNFSLSLSPDVQTSTNKQFFFCIYFIPLKWSEGDSKTKLSIARRWDGMKFMLIDKCHLGAFCRLSWLHINCFPSSKGGVIRQAEGIELQTTSSNAHSVDSQSQDACAHKSNINKRHDNSVSCARFRKFPIKHSLILLQIVISMCLEGAHDNVVSFIELIN